MKIKVFVTVLISPEASNAARLFLPLNVWKYT